MYLGKYFVVYLTFGAFVGLYVVNFVVYLGIYFVGCFVLYLLWYFEGCFVVYLTKSFFVVFVTYFVLECIRCCKVVDLQPHPLLWVVSSSSTGKSVKNNINKTLLPNAIKYMNNYNCHNQASHHYKVLTKYLVTQIKANKLNVLTSFCKILHFFILMFHILVNRFSF